MSSVVSIAERTLLHEREKTLGILIATRAGPRELAYLLRHVDELSLEHATLDRTKISLLPINFFQFSRERQISFRTKEEPV